MLVAAVSIVVSCSVDSGEGIVDKVPLPSPVVEVQSLDAASFTIVWEEVTGAASYSYRCGWSGETGTVEDTLLSFGGLEAGNAYTVYVASLPSPDASLFLASPESDRSEELDAREKKRETKAAPSGSCIVASPLTGEAMPLEQVEDGVFSEKMVGDGFAVQPSENRVYAPCDCTVLTVFGTKHAIGLSLENGSMGQKLASVHVAYGEDVRDAGPHVIIHDHRAAHSIHSGSLQMEGR